MQYGLSNKNIYRIRQIFKLYPEVEKVFLFGSRARGRFRSASDVDLALQGAFIRLETVLRISRMLDDLMLPIQFDLVVYDHIRDPNLLRQIDEDGVCLYQKNSEMLSRSS